MKPEQDDKWLEATIRHTVGSEEAKFDADRWKKKYHHEVESLESRKKPTTAPAHRGWRLWRSIMSTRSSTIAASAAIVAGFVVAVFMLATGDSSRVAMAAVLQELQTKCYEFEISVLAEDGTGIPMKGMVLEPGKLRLEQSGVLGTVTGIADTDAGHSLILFSRSKAAYRFDTDEAKQDDGFGFLMLPSRSIDELWSLKAGDETSLGKKDVAGKSAEGFQVTLEDEQHTQSITVWADAKTGHPLEVEIVSQSSAEEKVELKLSDFRVVSEPNSALFSTKVPEGYTLAESEMLEPLTAESDAASSTTENTSAPANTVLDAIALWADGKQQKAIELMVTVDWSADFRFGREHHFFVMKERQYMSLVSEDQEKVSAVIRTQVVQCRAMYRELLRLGRHARVSKDAAQAEKYFTTAARLGWLLSRNNDMLLLVRMVGTAIRKDALIELSSLYEEQGETEKLRSTQAQISQIEEDTK